MNRYCPTVTPGNRRWIAALPALLCLVIVVVARPAQCGEIVRIERRALNRIHSESFRVHRRVEVQLRCEGSGDAGDHKMFAYGWIVDLRTREIAWELTHREARRTRGSNFAFEGPVTLEPGEYTAHFAPYTQRYKSIIVLGKEIGRYRISSKRKPRDAKYWGLWISTDASDDDDVEALEPPVHVNDPSRVLDLTRMGDDDFDSYGFTLPQPMQITVYCQGEYVDRESGAVDVGWILNADSRRRVWEFGPDNFQHGGGAEKNKVARETIRLPAGNYVANYTTDGSHSYEGWNAIPPRDPEGWGLIVWAKNAQEAARITPYDAKKDPETSIVALTRQRNGAYVTQGITLKDAARLRVYALGELDRGARKFVDQGWITNFENGRTIWEMQPETAEHAGGHRKNRQSDEVIELPKGSYVVGYSTDDSHAYREWNATPPHDPAHWGISIMAADNDLSEASFELFDADARADAGRDFVARIVRVGDNARERKSFKLERRTALQIVAVGEGLYNQMYDYAWIEEKETGHWIWEMTMRNTRHAGGAQKNRIFNGVIDLGPGKYIVHYESDDSHSWNNFNDDRPRDANGWGITITVADP